MLDGKQFSCLGDEKSIPSYVMASLGDLTWEDCYWEMVLLGQEPR